MAVYAIDKLIAETRRLAAEFRRTTGQSLPVSSEIARHDVVRLLNLVTSDANVAGVDAVGTGPRKGTRFQVKARVIDDKGSPGARIGNINPAGEWDNILLVILNVDYEPVEIYDATKEDIETLGSSSQDSQRKRRGALSVARFKNISELIWTKENGLEREIWNNN